MTTAPMRSAKVSRVRRPGCVIRQRYLTSPCTFPDPSQSPHSHTSRKAQGIATTPWPLHVGHSWWISSLSVSVIIYPFLSTLPKLNRIAPSTHSGTPPAWIVWLDGRRALVEAFRPLYVDLTRSIPGPFLDASASMLHGSRA